MISAIIVIIGCALSGPVGVVLVKLIHPQPPWENAITFAENYHIVQSIPYIFGIILLFGFLGFFSSLPKGEGEYQRVMKKLTGYFAGLYAITIFTNYFLQLAIVPNYLSNEAIIRAIAADNAYSLFWYIEMVGYGFLGFATWTAAALFPGNGKLAVLRVLLILNGVTSLFSAIWNFVDVGWVFSTFGIVSYVLWNLLVIVIMVYVLLIYKDQKAKPMSIKPKKH